MSKQTFKLETSVPHQVIAQERLYLTSDRKTVVRDGDKDAAFLLAAVGQPIPIKLAQSLGLVDAPEVKAAPASGTEPEARQTRPAKPTHTR
jgi:hypothetical protein